MTEKPHAIPSEPAQRTTGHEQVSERLERNSMHIDMAAEIALLRSEQNYSRVGRSGKTLVKRPDFRVLLSAIRAGTRVAEHATAGPLTVQVVQGRVRMHVAEGSVDLPTGHLLALNRNEPHDVEALEDSAFLLTIAWPQEA